MLLVGAWKRDTDGLRDTVSDLAAHMREHIKEEEDLAFPEFENVLDPDSTFRYMRKHKSMEDNLAFLSKMRWRNLPNVCRTRSWGWE